MHKDCPLKGGWFFTYFNSFKYCIMPKWISHASFS